MYIGFGWGNLRVTDHLKDPGIDGRIICRGRCRNLDRAETELICLRLGTSGCLL